jgi:hypothetical protein
MPSSSLIFALLLLLFYSLKFLFAFPNIVYVLPEPVAPYAKIVPLYPCRTSFTVYLPIS